MGLRVSQAELLGLHTELMGPQVSDVGLGTTGLTTELTVDAAAGLGTGMNGQVLRVTGVAVGEVGLRPGRSAMFCRLSRSQYANMECSLILERERDTNDEGTGRHKYSFSKLPDQCCPLLCNTNTTACAPERKIWEKNGRDVYHFKTLRQM